MDSEKPNSFFKRLFKFVGINIENLNLNFNKTLIINTNKSYTEFKEDSKLKKELLDYFEKDHTNDKLRLSLNYEKEEFNFNPLEQFEVLMKKQTLIKLLKRSNLSEKYRVKILNAIYLKEELKKTKNYQKELNKLNPLEKRIFNLYSSGWIEKLLNYCQQNYQLQIFPKEFEDLVKDETLIFVHNFFSKDELKKICITTLIDHNYCILHAIGSSLNRNLKILLKEVNDELPKDSYQIIYKKENQNKIKNGFKYVVSLDIKKTFH